MKTTYKQTLLAAVLAGALAFTTTIVCAADFMGDVQGAGKPIAGLTVTLFAAGTSAPTQLAQGKTDDQGVFKLTYADAPGASVLYVVARTPQAAADKKPNDAIALLAVLGGMPPPKIIVNEFSTIASVWTANQFLEGEAGSRAVDRPGTDTVTVSPARDSDSGQ
jgi:hypothetical protein